MLVESVLRMYSKPRRRNYFGISSISPCPRQTYLNYLRFLQSVNQLKEDQAPPRTEEEQDETNPQLQMLLDDGNYQEAQIIDLLRRAGYKITHTGPDQARVTIGRSRIPGHPDGFIHLDNGGSQYHAMLEVKARNYPAFHQFEQFGLEAFPHIKCQVQLYLNSDGLPYPDITECRPYFKHKETTASKDGVEHKDPEYAGPIIEATDKILLEGWIPEPVENPLCVGCRYSSLCWGGARVVDFSGFKYLALPEVSQQWIKGYTYKTMGEDMMLKSEQTLAQEIGDVEEMLTDGLLVTQRNSPKRRFKRKRFIQENGEDVYNQYCDFTKEYRFSVRLSH